MAPLASDNKPKLRWLVADLNSYFASCEQQEEPSLRGKPVAVAPLMADTTCAIAASYSAKAYGVKTGTKIGDAKRMCPDLIVVQSRPKLYVEYHHLILDAIESCIPI
jgi:DNA polymerase-4